MPTRRLIFWLPLFAVLWPAASAQSQESHYRSPAALQVGSEPVEVAGTKEKPRSPRRAAQTSTAQERTAQASTPRDGTSTGLLLPARRGTSKARGEGESLRGGSPIFTVISGLAIVLGLFTLVVWLAKRGMPQASAALPADVVQVLGRAPLAHRQNMHLVRVGNKLLLLCVTPQGAETLTEIDDPLQVEQLASACERQRPGSITATFRQVLAQVGEERTAPGFLGKEAPATRPLKVRRQD